MRAVSTGRYEVTWWTPEGRYEGVKFCAHIEVEGYSVVVGGVQDVDDSWMFALNMNPEDYRCHVCGTAVVQLNSVFPQATGSVFGGRPTRRQAMKEVERRWQRFERQYLREQATPSASFTPEGAALIPKRWEPSELVRSETDLVIEFGNTDVMLGCVLDLDRYDHNGSGGILCLHAAKVTLLCLGNCGQGVHDMQWIGGKPILSRCHTTEIGVFATEARAKAAVEKALAESGTTAALVAAITGRHCPMKYIESTSGRKLPITNF